MGHSVSWRVHASKIMTTEPAACSVPHTIIKVSPTVKQQANRVSNLGATMKNDVLDVLMYIFERFQDQEYVVIEEASKLADELTEVGFSDVEIDSALQWIDGLVELRENSGPAADDESKAVFTNRLYTDAECDVLNLAARGYLYHLESLGVLDSESREAVIERLLALEIHDVDLEQLKWVTMMVLFNLPGRESACAWFENLDYHIH